jgi:protein-tyrosine phosphatase
MMVDIHSHLLPGVDDGAPTIAASVPVLERFGADGVDTLVCTPHLRATEAARAPIDRHRAILEELLQYAPQLPRLVLGWEIMLDAPGADLRAAHLHLGESSAALVEFPRMGVPPGATHELLRIRMSGVTPVVAHPERYQQCTPELVREWRSVGAVMQLDAVMVFGNAPISRLARTLLEQGLIDCISSDNHGDSRSLRSARDWLEELGAHEQAELLTNVNARRLLGNEAVLPVTPIPPTDRGMLAHLRALFMRRS